MWDDEGWWHKNCILDRLNIEAYKLMIIANRKITTQFSLSLVSILNHDAGAVELTTGEVVLPAGAVELSAGVVTLAAFALPIGAVAFYCWAP